MRAYDVTVRNETTGEVEMIEIQSEDRADAQVEALLQMFKQRGWRKAIALRPEPMQHAA